MHYYLVTPWHFTLLLIILQQQAIIILPNGFFRFLVAVPAVQWIAMSAISLLPWNWIAIRKCSKNQISCRTCSNRNKLRHPLKITKLLAVNFCSLILSLTHFGFAKTKRIAHILRTDLCYLDHHNSNATICMMQNEIYNHFEASKSISIF